MRGRPTASDHPPKGLPPLHLGETAGGRPVLTVEESGASAKIEIPGEIRGTRVGIGKRGAVELADWLHTWANPRAKLVLWGIDGIITECGVSRRTAYRWMTKPDFPAPLPVIGGNGQVWEARAVKAWVRLKRPQTGRPRKQKARGA